MKILYLGSYQGKGDEGLTQLSKRISSLSSKNNQTISINTKDLIKITILIKIIKFKPEIIHYITGATIKSFILLKVIKMINKNNYKTVLSAVRVFMTSKQIKLIKHLKPDLVLSQSKKWEEVFIRNSIKTNFLCNPIDCSRYSINQENKETIRRKYNLPINNKLLLHVGHIRKNRNLDFFILNKDKIHQAGIDLLVVGSSFHKIDINLKNKLISAGFHVISEFIDKMEEVYRMSDIYVFPVEGLQSNYFPRKYEEVGVIDMPLSILEAICCGIPVVSTEIDSLKRLIENGVRLPITFFNTQKPDSFINSIKKSLKKEKSLKYDFGNIFNENLIIRQMENYYMELRA
jgi:glycosyltransferase involved in cell wall biosynthesis